MESTLPPSPSYEQVEDELVFTDVLLSTLDPGDDEFEQKRSEIEAKRSHYESLLSSMRSNNGPRYSAMLNDNFHSSMDGTNDSPGNTWVQPAMNDGPGVNINNPSGGLKRPRDQSFYLQSQEQPSKRQTPDPSNAGTPVSSESSYELIEHEPSERARVRQAAAEAALKRQQADAAMARELNQQARATSNFASSSRQPSRPGFQTTLNSNGSYQRPPLIVKPEAPTPLERPSGYQRYTPQRPNPAYHPQSAPSQIKSEPGLPTQHQLAQRPRQQAQVVDLTGSDSDNDEVAEIAPDRFTPRRRQDPVVLSHNYAHPRPLHTPAPTSMQMQTTMQRMSGSYPGMQPPPGYQVYGNGVMNSTPQPSFSTSSYPWLGPAMNGIRDMTNGVSDSMRQLRGLITGTSSAQPWELDSDDDDLIFGGSRSLPGYGNYAGNEDLYRSRRDALQNYDPFKSDEEIQALLENIRPDEEMPAHLRVQTPEAMSVSLHKYQELGLTWLKNCEEGSNKGGILADDMGLGKTIQMLALIVSRKSQDPRCKTTLIVAPVALMRQWRQEINDKLKSRHKLTVFTHHGTRKAKSFDQLRAYDVVLTTYGTLASELKRREKFVLRQQTDRNARPYPTEKCLFIDPDSQWYRVILDEAQYIKNKSTQTAKGACQLKSQYRFCVTGTPMMNNVEELYSLIHFLRIKPYCQWEKFRFDFNLPLRNGSDEIRSRAMQMLQALCKAIMLRRTKKSTFEGKPILVLPDRSTTVSNPVFDDSERELYKAIETQSKLEFNKYLRRGTFGQSYTAILVLLLRLRQACCHPHLIKDFGVAAAAGLQEDDMLEFARQLDPAVVARIKATGGNFECPVCYDVTPNPAIFIPCGHNTCSECFAKIADPANAIQNGEEHAGVKCPECRDRIDPKRLTDFQCFKKVHMPELLTEVEIGQGETGQADDDEEESSDTDDSDDEDADDDEDENSSLDGFVVNDDEDDDDADADETDDDLDRLAKKEEVEQGDGNAGPSSRPEGEKSHNESQIKKKKGKGKKSKKGKGKGKQKAKKPKSAVRLADLKKQAAKSKAAKRKYLRRLRETFISSAKIDKTMELLKDIMDNSDGEKVLVFSQWTSLLDLLEVPIDGEGYGYRRYDGSMKPSDRGDAVDDFRDNNKGIRIMLVSLKAGNAGLNLNMASRVIILDPFWNPYIEEQAIDRAHRLGQTRPVIVHRILIEETVEDRIIALQEEKRALISEALDEKSGANLARLGVQELAYLFGITNNRTERVNYTARERR